MAKRMWVTKWSAATWVIGMLEKQAWLSADLIWSLDAADGGQNIDYAKEENHPTRLPTIRILDPWREQRSSGPE